MFSEHRAKEDLTPKKSTIAMNSDQKWILVTGASTGIGKACAELLIEKGFSVYAGVRSDVDIDYWSKQRSAVPLRLDVTSVVDVKRVETIIKEEGNGLFGLLNNAGIAVAGPLMDIPMDEFQKQFDVNLFGIHRITQALFPLILKENGRIVMMSSDSGFFATPFFGPYCSSKFALEGYSDSLRRELNLLGVDVVVVQPGRIKTPIWNKGELLLEKYQQSLLREKAVALGRHAIEKGLAEGLDPERVAIAVYKAFSVKKPRPRYIVASEAVKYKVIQHLSDRLVDGMIRRRLNAL